MDRRAFLRAVLAAFLGAVGRFLPVPARPVVPPLPPPGAYRIVKLNANTTRLDLFYGFNVAASQYSVRIISD